ncbi:hypothetical protein BZA77DRAFT_346724 [Pyronema omphalodes]|nr:hypothetical protein BZA77DRAFT_346724 [Pyronema omphalodes]
MSYNYDSDGSDCSLPPVVVETKGRRIQNYSYDFDDQDQQPQQQEHVCRQCHKKFSSQKRLISHMDTEEDHEYCKKHDELFDTWEEYGIHRVNHREHKTCEHCYRDFQSKEGLRIHIEQFHKDVKTTLCPYCNKKFKGGLAGLSMHIESNQCTGGMTHEEMKGRAKAIRTASEPVPPSAGPTPSESAAAAAAKTKTGTPIDEATAKLKNLTVQPESNTANDLGVTFEGLKSYFQPLFNKYCCPCGKKFHNTHAMWQHVQSIAHQKKTFHCIGCQKYFISSSALLQHQESGSCRIDAETAFVAADRATGGLASATAAASGSVSASNVGRGAPAWRAGRGTGGAAASNTTTSVPGARGAWGVPRGGPRTTTAAAGKSSMVFMVPSAAKEKDCNLPSFDDDE